MRLPNHSKGSDLSLYDNDIESVFNEINKEKTVCIEKKYHLGTILRHSIRN